jgi:hypothetical protein
LDAFFSSFSLNINSSQNRPLIKHAVRLEYLCRRTSRVANWIQQIKENRVEFSIIDRTYCAKFSCISIHPSQPHLWWSCNLPWIFRTCLFAPVRYANNKGMTEIGPKTSIYKVCREYLEKLDSGDAIKAELWWSVLLDVIIFHKSP